MGSPPALLQVVSCRRMLRPTSSVLTTRYEKRSRAVPGHTKIAPGFCTYTKENEPPYLPQGWASFQHPEGQLYFACHSQPSIVTESNIYAPEVRDEILRCVDEFNRLLLESGTSLSGSTELFLELDDTADTCLYYLVDYTSRVEFWIEEVDSEELGMPAVVSESHRRLTLEEHFWAHVEHFPSHPQKELDLNRDELVAIFVHARADQMTSAYSTFPYGAQKCTEFLELLNSASCSSVNLYSTALIARLWAVIYNHRFSIHYGEEHARLSRDQSILDVPEVHKSIAYKLVSRLLFGIPEHYNRSLDDLYVDNLVYVDHWRGAMASCCEEWTRFSCWGLALMIIDIMSFWIPGTSPVLVLSSILLCAIAVLSAVALLVRMHGAPQFHAAQAADYLSEAKHETTGFQWTALGYSLPKALFVWALVAFCAQTVVWLLVATNVYVVGALMGTMLLLALASRAVVVPWPVPEGGLWSALRALRAGAAQAEDSAV